MPEPALWKEAIWEVPTTVDADARVGHLLGAGCRRGESPLVVLAGFPSDEGVRRNNGRVGAGDGPEAIRRWFAQLTPESGNLKRFCSLLERTADLGDFRVSGDLGRDQEAFAKSLSLHVRPETKLIVLGGGHETSYAHFLTHVEAGQGVSILNWDAHADVRELKDGLGHSGSPFRQALEHPSGKCHQYSVAGLQRHANASAHLEYVKSKGGQSWAIDELTPETMSKIYGQMESPWMVSFDLDAVDAAFAPGVSAPCTGGFCIHDWLAAAEAAGKTPGVKAIDLVELNPSVDRDEQTARLAALTLWRFYHGLAAR